MNRSLLVVALLFAPACGASLSDPREGAGQAPTDQLEPLRTADGQVIGADGVPPETKLATGAKAQALPTPSVLPAAQPPGHEAPASSAGVPEDPRCNDPALDEATRKARCRGAPPKTQR